MVELSKLRRGRPGTDLAKWVLAWNTSEEQRYVDQDLADACAWQVAQATGSPQIVTDLQGYVKYAVTAENHKVYNTSRVEDQAWHNDTN